MPIDCVHRDAQGLDHAGVVGHRCIDFRMCALQHITTETLRRLGRAESVSWQCAEDRSILGDRLDRVRDRDYRDDGFVP